MRQPLVDGMPVVQTSMRVPGGDAVQRVYGAPVPDVGEVAVVEIANESPAPFVVALVVRGANRIDQGDTTVYVDGRNALRTTRPPSRWAMAADGTTEEIVTSGAASDAPFAARQDRAARLVGAFLYPVAHRTTFRAAIALGTRGLGAVDLAALPGADAVVRGWRAQLDRGLRVELPDPALQAAIDAARPAAVLAGQAWKVDPGGRGAGGLGPRRRGRGGMGPVDRARAAPHRRREPSAGSWAACGTVAAAWWCRAVGRGSRRRGRRRRHDADPARRTGPTSGVGLASTSDAPTRRGPVSYSVRWHGDRPALLWDAPEGVARDRARVGSVVVDQRTVLAVKTTCVAPPSLGRRPTRVQASDEPEGGDVLRPQQVRGQ